MKFVGQTAENDICSTRLGRRSCLHGRPSCHGLMSAKLPRAVAIFPRAKKPLKASFVLLFFFLSSFFPSPFYNDMIDKTGMVDSFEVSLSSSFIRKLFFLMKLELSETSKLSTIPVLPIMSLFSQSPPDLSLPFRGESLD